VATRVKVRFQGRTTTVLFWLMALAGVALAFTVATLPALARTRALDQQVQELEQENTQLREQLNHLTLEEQALKNDRFYNEALARRELGLVKPGERIAWTPPGRLRDLPLTPASASIRTAGQETRGASVWSGLERLGALGPYVSRALEQLTTNRDTRRDGLLLSLALLAAALLLFGQPEPSTPTQKVESASSRSV
jgi:cell division protein FtsB